MMRGVHLTRAPSETRDLAARVAAQLRGGEVLLLEGDLGTGKTCFVQGLAAALGFEGPVTSPTYALVQEYPSDPPLAHADLYRLSGAGDIEDLGLEELWEAGRVVAVEWSSIAPAFWPAHAWRIHFSAGEGPEDRRVEIMPGEGG